MVPLLDLRGRRDARGRPLETTLIAIADERRRCGARRWGRRPRSRELRFAGIAPLPATAPPAKPSCAPPEGLDLFP